MVEHAARRPGHDLRARLELLDLLAHRRAAVDGDDVQLVGGDLLALLANLQRELARRRQAERLHFLLLAVDEPLREGMPNAAVLPEPVRDCTITSLPAIMRG